MGNQIISPRGTQDLLPQDSYRWQYVERKAIEIAGLFGFEEMRVPTFEHTELYNRGVGDTTDVVQKEMYTFLDKGNRSVSLRPEITSGVCRSVIQNGLLGANPLPIRACYVASCFRYEKKQATRLREFHQFGVEAFGAKGPVIDAQIIGVAHQLLETLEVQNVHLEINSIGCATCRPQFQKELISFFKKQEDALCPTCKERLEKNPMRILDCKEERCKEIAAGAPSILDDICEECQEHFDGLQKHLTAMQIPFVIESTIVRGLDYYSKTVFEFVGKYEGENVTICGGGRYDGLITQLGGSPTPAMGFGMGLERLLLVMAQGGSPFPQPNGCDIYLAPISSAATLQAQRLLCRLHQEGFRAQSDVMERSLKAQLKYANKIGARFSMVLGDDELATQSAVLKNMQTGENFPLSLEEEALTRALYGQLYELSFEPNSSAEK